jgi:hypothetical protein
VDVADLNGDGTGDLIAGGLTVDLSLLQFHTVHFYTGASLTSGGEPISKSVFPGIGEILFNHTRLVAKDFYGDQYLDLAFGDFDSGEVRHYRGTGMSTSGHYSVQILKVYDPFNGLLNDPNSGGVWVG